MVADKHFELTDLNRLPFLDQLERPENPELHTRRLRPDLRTCQPPAAVGHREISKMEQE